tara:strand:- start:223 stop:1671 length:1449 start_codon:yes stop_codon:yes gene_type:complete
MDIAKRIDDATDANDSQALVNLLEECNRLIHSADSKRKVKYHFYKANCHSGIWQIKTYQNEIANEWTQEDKLSEILSLRKAVSEPAFMSMDSIFRSKILTNLGNALSYLGRFVEAIKYWDLAISTTPKFSMALGNKGICLISYAQFLYDHGHAGIVFAHAEESLREALLPEALWDSEYPKEVADCFITTHNGVNDILEEIAYDYNFDLDHWKLGDSSSEEEYRRWCLDNGLFLSPLNDVCTLTVAARDILHLPTHRYNIGEDPRFLNFYNIIKQEYATARFILYSSANSEHHHYSDNDILLIKGHNAVLYGYKVEKLKLSYRMAYSIFDKISLFVNDYFKIGIKPKDVTFRKIWGENRNREFHIRNCFSESNNWPLKGLYYLSKDLFDKDFKETSLPESEELSEIRNYLEHKLVSLQEYPDNAESSETHIYIDIVDFERKTLRVLSMAREAIIYLSLAMHWKERNIVDDSVVIPFPRSPVER